MPTIEEIKLALVAAGILVACALTGHFVHQIDLAKLQRVELEYQQKQAVADEAAKAEQARLVQLAHDADSAELTQQKQMLADAQTRIVAASKRVTRGSKDNCITWELVRTIDAAALNVDPDTLPFPAGKIATACAGIDAGQLTAGIVANYGIDQRNIAHGQALQDYLNKLSQVKR